jgi:hypothetical protein
MNQNSWWTLSLFFYQKKNDIETGMEGLQIGGLLLLFVIGIGALLQTLGFLPTRLDSFLKTVTLVGIGLSLCFLLLSFFLSYREGFEDKPQGDPMLRWKGIVADLQLDELCAKNTELREKLFQLAKGAPPEEATDQQALEEVNRKWASIGADSLDCLLVQQLSEAKDLSEFALLLQSVDTVFLAQAVGAAKGLRKLLATELEKAQSSTSSEELQTIQPSLEGFVSVCTVEQAAERRKFLRQRRLEDAARTCLLPEEVESSTRIKNPEGVSTEDTLKGAPVSYTTSIEMAEAVIPSADNLQTKLSALLMAYEATRETIPAILRDIQDLQDKIDAKGKAAESGELTKDLVD